MRQPQATATWDLGTWWSASSSSSRRQRKALIALDDGPECRDRHLDRPIPIPVGLAAGVRQRFVAERFTIAGCPFDTGFVCRAIKQTP